MLPATFSTKDMSESVPISYALLLLPPKKELRKKGYTMAGLPASVSQHLRSTRTQSNVQGGSVSSARDHALARWTTHALPKGATYRDALDAVEDANRTQWGFLKGRIQFATGGFDTYARRNPNDAATLACVGTYDPNSVFRGVTAAAAMESRTRLLPRLRPLVNEHGHYTQSQSQSQSSSAKTLPRTFAPQVLYASCPPPVLSQAGYDFTPMSHISFLLRPSEPSTGARDVRSDFVPMRSSDYRPRAYNRGTAGGRHCHCAEVYQVGDYTMDLARDANTINQRNCTVKHSLTRTGTVKPNSTIVGRRHAKAPAFPCEHQGSAVKETTRATAMESMEADRMASEEKDGNGERRLPRETENRDTVDEAVPVEKRSVRFNETPASMA
ncbi:uncharacterized protein TM35_000401300 [Trypanosoma theileri]|uniref:Uncharacterized protein n=1 Tax=Trypanosoma theileri TaxID=67003 RepID=A0A1X0NK79_9TRYP|nr:uncharacterized protein TM35_000401300 [Trypanosoma theileri]ORC84863.1 hypothetical protein TM35_000401300 [Trypanosoma theileri]